MGLLRPRRHRRGVPDGRRGDRARVKRRLSNQGGYAPLVPPANQGGAPLVPPANQGGAPLVPPANQGGYAPLVPPAPGDWPTAKPEDAGLDPRRLDDAIAYHR